MCTVSLYAFLSPLRATDEISKLLLEEAKMDPNAKNNTGDTPLHTACRNERSKQVQLLVRDERCNPNEKDSNGDTALHVSCRLNKTGKAHAHVHVLECMWYL